MYTLLELTFSKASRPSVLLVALALGQACNNDGGQTEMSTEQQHQDDLLLLLWEYPAYPVSEPPVSGPVFAVWGNGRILQRDGGQEEQAMSRPSEHSAWSYVEGTLDDGQLDRLRSLLDSIEPRKEQWLTLDAASESLHVRRGKEFIVIAESRPPDGPKESIIRPVKDLLCSFEVAEPRRLSGKPDVGPPWRLPRKFE